MQERSVMYDVAVHRASGMQTQRPTLFQFTTRRLKDFIDLNRFLIVAALNTKGGAALT